jgi:PBP1b-binding outer membrane lipoprotein LpoB
MIRRLMISITLGAALLMTGCASVPMASKNDDAQAKQFTPAQNMASLDIYRNETFGSAIKMPLLIDGMTVGDTVAHS